MQMSIGWKLKPVKEEKHHRNGNNGVNSSNSVPTVPWRFKVSTGQCGFIFFQRPNVQVLQ
jgi:hypothetical protein